MPLTATQVKQAKPWDRDDKLYDSRGVFVPIATNGSKYRHLEYRVEGKEETLALGMYPDVRWQKPETSANRGAAR